MRRARLLAGVCLLAAAACGGPGAPSSPTAATTPGTEACRFTPANTLPVFDAAGGTASLSIPIGAGCRWTIEAASSADSWIALESPVKNVGPAAVAIVTAPNRSLTARTGAFVVRHADGDVLAVYTVAQRAAGCLYSVSPDSLDLSWMGTYDGAGDSPVRVSVHAEPATCQWTAASTVPWIRVVYNSGAGTGDATVYLSITVWNEAPQSKTGEVVIAGLSGVNPDARVTITQRPR